MHTENYALEKVHDFLSTRAILGIHVEFDFMKVNVCGSMFMNVYQWKRNEMVPSRERIHIPPGEVRKIIDSKVPAGKMIC